MAEALLTTALPFPKRSGKVRDVYDLSESIGEPVLLIVATDRISAYDCVMPNGVPGKGKLLTAISNFWFEHLKGFVFNHLIETDADRYPAVLQPFKKVIAGRSVLVRKTMVVPVECVARGYLAGSGWAEYRQTGRVCGVQLPEGLQQSQQLPAPIFTPATKAEHGHDENISFERMAGLIDPRIAEQLRDLTLRLYNEAASYAASRGIIVADTKFEFGLTENGLPMLIDEALTPDSSRFWPADDFEPGRDQQSYDKQYVRNYLSAQAWDRTPPAPTLPHEVVEGTRQRYIQAYEKLTGRPWREA